MSSEFSLSDFGVAWRKFIENVNNHTPPPEPPPPPLADKVIAFLGADPTTMAVLKETLLGRDLPNLQMALDRFLTGPERWAELLGFMSQFENPDFGLTTLISKHSPWQAIPEGPVRYRSIELANGERLQCVEKGVYLIHDHGTRVVMLIYAEARFYGRDGITLELLCQDAERAEALLSEIRKLIHLHNVYRGHVISLGAQGPDDIRFHHLPAINRADIVLPPKLLEALELNTLGFAEYAPRLQAAGRHLKRGLLFHGSPGTGKTMSIMYLISQMSGRTVILLTGQVMELIAQSCQLARWLAPSVVVLEDVDLVAQERTHEGAEGPLLFELLNEMDGLASDTEALFILSTNRPDLLEPALAARPGRIDQTFEFPLPDEACRRRLFELYGQGLQLNPEGIEAMVRRTEGASPAFIRELLRKASLIAADQNRGSSEPLLVSDSHLREALHAILTEGGALTKHLLGVAPGALEDPQL